MVLTLLQDAAQQPQGSVFGMFVPMILVFVVFYFLLIRPQQKQQKQLQGMIANLRAGDDVITRSGVHGRITSINDNLCTVEIAKNVEVTMNKDQVAFVKNQETTKASANSK